VWAVPDAPPAAVLFDNDGLTLDTEVCWTRAESVLFDRRGRTFTLEDKRALLGTAASAAMAGLERLLDAPGEGQALLDELHVLVWDELATVEAMPGALDLLDRLDAAGIPFGMASNSPRELVDRALLGAGIADRFAYVLSADDVEHPKPAPDLYLRLAGAFDADAADCVVLEDSPTGVAAARAAGATVVGVPSLEGVVLEADLVATSLADPALHALLGLRP
jgi:HAD superfamily hydrolase (TIGR01509 family)